MLCNGKMTRGRPSTNSDFFYVCVCVCMFLCIQGGPKSKPLSVIIIKSYLNPPLWLDFSSISTRKWVQKYNKYVLNILCDLIFDVITCCVWSCNTGEINASDKIIFEDQKKKKKYGNKRNFLHKSPSKRLFWNGIHGLLRRDDARGSDNIIYRIWCVLLVCRSVIVIEIRK